MNLLYFRLFHVLVIRAKTFQASSNSIELFDHLSVRPFWEAVFMRENIISLPF
jgi:hypothetical protein